MSYYIIMHYFTKLLHGSKFTDLRDILMRVIINPYQSHERAGGWLWLFMEAENDQLLWITYTGNLYDIIAVQNKTLSESDSR